MAVRRTPYLGASNRPGGGMSGPEQAMPMPPRPGMPMSPMGSMAPAPTAGTMPGMGAPGGGPGGPGGAPGMAGMPPPPPPPQPTAGGPTSPMNISSMLQPRQQPGQPPNTPGMGAGPQPGSGQGQGPQRVPPTPLPPWGDSQGSAPLSDSSLGPQSGAASGITGLPDTNGDAADPHSPLVFLKLLKALGQV